MKSGLLSYFEKCLTSSLLLPLKGGKTYASGQSQSSKVWSRSIPANILLFQLFKDSTLFYCIMLLNIYPTSKHLKKCHHSKVELNLWSRRTFNFWFFGAWHFFWRSFRRLFKIRNLKESSLHLSSPLTCRLKIIARRSNNTVAIDVKLDRSIVGEKSSFKMPGLTFSSKLDWDSCIIPIAKTAFKKIITLILSIKFLSPEVALHFYKSTILPCMEYCCHVWAGAPSCCFELSDKNF